MLNISEYDLFYCVWAKGKSAYNQPWRNGFIMKSLWNDYIIYTLNLNCKTFTYSHELHVVSFLKKMDIFFFKF